MDYFSLRCRFQIMYILTIKGFGKKKKLSNSAKVASKNFKILKSVFCTEFLKKECREREREKDIISILT